MVHLLVGLVCVHGTHAIGTLAELFGNVFFFKRHVAPQRPKLPQGFGQEGKQEPPPTPSAGRVFT